MMNKILLFISFSVLASLKATALELPPPDVVFVDSLIETFESDTSDAWVLESNWLIDESTNLGSTYFPIPEHGVVAAINDDAAGQGTLLAGRLISPPIVRIPDNNYLLNFAAFFINGDFQGADERAEVQISTDQSNWITLFELDGATDWQTISLIVPSIPDEDTLYLAFHYDDGAGWNYGFAVDDVTFRPAGDYAATATVTQQPLYTQRTLKQMVPVTWAFDIENLGNLSLTDIVANVDIETPTGIDNINENLPEIAPLSSETYQFEYFPTETGEYLFNISLSHPEIDDNIYQETLTFTVSDSLLSRDDGSQESGLGFGFGDPSWYGYYGSNFELVATDTLTAITVQIANGSTIANSSINFTVTAFDDDAVPTDEVFHSESILLEEAMDLGFNVTYQLSEPVILPPNNYIFAAGQDTLQGIVGFGFDQNNITQEGFWLTSPVAGGGYPWANIPNRETLIIQPHLKNPNISTGVRAPILQEKVRLFPNPAHDWLTVDLSTLTASAQSLTIYNSEGKVLAFEKIAANIPQKLDIADYSKGLYLLKIQTAEGIVVTEFIKH